MSDRDPKLQRLLEVILIIVAIGLTGLLHVTAGHKITVLNLYYLPVVLAGFYLGRYRAGILAFLCVVLASAVVVIDLNNFAAFTSPVAAIMAVMIWSAVLGLTALLVGTLTDERIAKANEAREAHVAVVEVLSRYLQSANPKLQNRAARVSKLSEQVARRLRLTHREIDDIKVASLLMDIEHVEITSRVIKKAVGSLEDDNDRHTIAGAELVQSLGSVLTGAFPLVLNQADEEELGDDETPIGAKILRTVRSYDEMIHDLWDGDARHADDAISEMENDLEANHHPAILNALSEVFASQGSTTESDNSIDEIEEILAQKN